MSEFCHVVMAKKNIILTVFKQNYNESLSIDLSLHIIKRISISVKKTKVKKNKYIDVVNNLTKNKSTIKYTFIYILLVSIVFFFSEEMIDLYILLK